MWTLLLRLEGPLQSWGTTSRFDERDTQLEPSKSGVLGLVCAALGRDRSAGIEDLARLTLGVRVDREGVPMRDYQTATGVLLASGKPDLDRTVVSPRFFLSDAAFLVGLAGPDHDLLSAIHAALRNPAWPLALGRKSFVPAAPVHIPGGLVEKPLLDALRSWPSVSGKPIYGSVRCLLEHPSEGAVRLDQPIAPFSERRFGQRIVKTEILDGVAHAPDPART